MKINRKQFISDLEVVSNALGTSGFILAFQCLHIKGKVVYATDGATSIKKILDYDTGIDCSIFGTPFLTTLSNIRSEEISLEQEKDKLVLLAKKIEGEFTVVAEAKGIKIPEYSSELACNSFDPSLMESLSSCKFAASRDETQGCFCGVYVDKNFVYSTDRFCIMRHVLSDSCGVEGLIFPIKLIEILEKLHTKESLIYVEGDSSGKVIVFLDKATTLEGCTLSGKYPDVASRFVDFKDLLTIEFDKSNIRDVLDRHIIFQKGVLDIDRSTSVEIEKDKAYFTTVDPNVGDLTEEVDVQVEFTTLVNFKINPVFLKQIVKEGSKLAFSPSCELIQIWADDFTYLAKIR